MGAPGDAGIAKRLWGDLLQGLGVEGSMLNGECSSNHNNCCCCCRYQQQQLLLLLLLLLFLLLLKSLLLLLLPTPAAASADACRFGGSGLELSLFYVVFASPHP